MEEESNEYYIRASKKFEELVKQISKDWEEKYGFSLSMSNITTMIAEKITKAGGVNI